MAYRVYAIQLSNWHPSASLPQAIGTIWSYAAADDDISKNYSLIDVFWQEESVDEVVENIVSPDILMCSCYVWNWEKTDQIIKIVKEKYPQCLVVIGGPEPKYSTEWMLEHSCVDVLVAYYGEVTFKNILKDHLNGKRDFDHIPGVVTRTANNKDRAVYPVLDEIPSPYLTGFFDNLLTHKRPDTTSVRAVYETNRGCPYSCLYCDMGAKEYQKVKQFSTERCVLELEWMVKNNIIVIDVADSNFGVFPRDEIFVDTLIDLKNKYDYKGSFMPTWSKTRGKHILKLGKKIIQSGLDTMYNISIQSTNSETLDLVRRTNAFKFEELSEVIGDLNNEGVMVYTDLIFPMPGDTAENFKTGLGRLLDLEHTFNKIQMNHLSRISNTPLNSPTTDNFKIEWATIKGNSKHYHGDNVKDTLAVASRSLSREEVFESNFIAKCVYQPFYYYGLSRNLCDILHKNQILTRSQVIDRILHELHSVPWFKFFKEELKEHYFSALNNKTHFGHKLDETEQYYPEYAKAYMTYSKNNIFDHISNVFFEYLEIVDYDKNSQWFNQKKDLSVEYKTWNKGVWTFKDPRVIPLNNYLSKLFIRGRFTDEWKVQTIICGGS